MNQEINYSRYIDRYLDGVMETDEKIWFEKELKDNKELEAELQFQKRIFEVISDNETMMLHTQLEEIHSNIYRPWVRSLNIPTSTIRRYMYVAGTVAATLAILMILWFTSSKDKVSTADLFAEYYQPAEINISFRTAEDIVDSDLRTAMFFYENKEYSKAITLFEKILDSDQTRIGLNLYSGISHMELNHYTKANENFRKIIDHKENVFIESAQWYLGLCYIKTGEIDKAKDIFESIDANNGYYKKEAHKVLKKLN